MNIVQVVFDELASKYDDTFQRKVDLVENRIAFSLVPCNGHILDLGCGTGLYLEYCHSNGYIGLDISPKMLEVARSKFPDHTFIEGDMANMPMLVDESFEAIISTFGSFSYCLQPEKAIDEMWRILQPGGDIFIMALSKRYRKRRSHIVGNRIPFLTWDRRSILKAFAKFQRVKVMGMSGYVAALVPEFMRLEMLTLGKLWPSSCYFQIIMGTKPDA